MILNIRDLRVYIDSALGPLKLALRVRGQFGVSPDWIMSPINQKRDPVTDHTRAYWNHVRSVEMAGGLMVDPAIRQIRRTLESRLH